LSTRSSRSGLRATAVRCCAVDFESFYEQRQRAAPAEEEDVLILSCDAKVRHEALTFRVGCETPPPCCRGSPVKLRAA
jgi:hypothetical protein